MPAHPEVAAVVMAGGKSSRLGELAQARPKCLLELPDGQTLLGRLLNQLQTAGISKVLVCCSSETFETIGPFVRNYRLRTQIPENDITAVAVAECSKGPLPALAQAVALIRSPWYLMCLADIVYVAAPFAKALAYLRQNRTEGLLITGSDQLSSAHAGSGFVHCEQSTVQAISYQPFDARDLMTHRCRRWSGAFFFCKKLYDEGCSGLRKQGVAPLETWIQGLLEQGLHCEWMDGGAFFNVNSRRDYEAVMAHRSQ